jgi:hypothetical protein
MMVKINRSKLMLVFSFGLFCHATGMESEAGSTGNVLPSAEYVSEWSSLFAGATNRVSEGSGYFAKLLMKQLAKKDAELRENTISFFFPDQEEDVDPDQLMRYSLNLRKAVKSTEVDIAMAETLKERLLCDISEWTQWKLFCSRFKNAKGGQRIMLVEDQRRWLVWRQEHLDLVTRAAGEGTGQSWFANIALNEIEEDRLNELCLFEEDYAEIYRDLKYASVRYKGRDVPLKQGRLYVEKDGETRVGRIINPVFCKRVVVGRDIYKFAIFEPDYIVDVGPNCDRFSWVCVWKNGKNSANYRLPISKDVRHLTLFSEEREKQSGIESISVKDALVTIMPSKSKPPIIIDVTVTNQIDVAAMPK